jgi:hypothetical protein
MRRDLAADSNIVAHAREIEVSCLRLWNGLSVYCPDSADNCPRTSYLIFAGLCKGRRHAVFEAMMRLASGLQHQSRKPHSTIQWRTAMKFETLMLNSLFAACVVLCVSTLAAMLA